MILNYHTFFRYLKPSNNVIKIGDFGLATITGKSFEDSATNQMKSAESHTLSIGTGLYLSPEQVQKKHYNLKVDIFAMGLILLKY